MPVRTIGGVVCRVNSPSSRSARPHSVNMSDFCSPKASKMDGRERAQRMVLPTTRASGHDPAAWDRRRAEDEERAARAARATQRAQHSANRRTYGGHGRIQSWHAGMGPLDRFIY